MYKCCTIEFFFRSFPGSKSKVGVEGSESSKYCTKASDVTICISQFGLKFDCVNNQLTWIES